MPLTSASVTSSGEPAARRRATAAGLIGTTLEWYDFGLYNQAAALVLAPVFFPDASPVAGTIAAFATQFVGFAARPLGAALFGHVGDRYGRRTALVATVTVMGIATTLIGLLPGYAAIGLAAPALLVLLRVVQGLAVGGEVAGAVILTMEWAGPRRRGLFASLPALGMPLALILATLALRLSTGPDRPEWAWRIPFLLSVVLLAAALVIRRAVPETPGFTGARREGALRRRPVWEVLRSHPRAVATSALVRTAEQAPQALFTTFVLSYGTIALRLPRTQVLDFTLFAGLTSLITIPLFAHLSDRWGRRRVTAAGIVALALFAFPYFTLLNRATGAAVLTAMVLSMVVHDMMFGPQPALIAERFPAEVRYSGAGLGSQLASVFAGGPAPLIAASIFAATGSSTGISWYLVGTAVVSMAALAFLPRPAAEMDVRKLEPLHS